MCPDWQRFVTRQSTQAGTCNLLNALDRFRKLWQTLFKSVHTSQKQQKVKCIWHKHTFSTILPYLATLFNLDRLCLDTENILQRENDYFAGRPKVNSRRADDQNFDQWKFAKICSPEASGKEIWRPTVKFWSTQYTNIQVTPPIMYQSKWHWVQFLNNFVRNKLKQFWLP